MAENRLTKVNTSCGPPSRSSFISWKLKAGGKHLFSVYGWQALMTPPEGHSGQHAYTFLIRILSPSLTSVFNFLCLLLVVTLGIYLGGFNNHSDGAKDVSEQQQSTSSWECEFTCLHCTYSVQTLLLNEGISLYRTLVATATFWCTFHHDGKFSPGCEGWGPGVHAQPLLLYLPSRRKLWTVVYSPLSS